MMDWNGHMSSGGWLSILALLIMVAIVGAAIVWIAREVGASRDWGPAPEVSARAILDRRLASGEINAGQYEELCQTLAACPEPVHAGG
jgi:uncharacterized membrane protein